MITAHDTFASVVDKLVGLVDSIVIPILFTLGFIFFLIGMVRLFFSQSQENREKGRQFVLWASIGLVVLFSVWGIVNLFLNLLRG